MDELVEKLCTLLAEHALDGDGPADGAMRDALQKSGVADLVKDAERYRWLRDGGGIRSLGYDDWGSGPTYASGDELDSEIDAVMKGANP